MTRRYKNAIVCTPCKNIVNGISSANLGKTDYNLAMKQHDAYVNALMKCKVSVHVMSADEDYPDSTFVEDAALVTPNCAIITNLAIDSRKGEIVKIEKVLLNYYSKLHYIQEPGVIEAGDIMMVENHFYIGLSNRTNKKGAFQVIAILEKFEHSGTYLTMTEMLHLKTGISYLENNNLIATGEFLKMMEFENYNIISIDSHEAYAANCVWINEKVIVPAGYAETRAKIEKEGYETIEVDVSEFRKLDGGLSCLSLRF